MLKPGTQILYVPMEMDPDNPAHYGYPYGIQPGFVTTDTEREIAFCRYWLFDKGKFIPELRTKSCGEGTPHMFIVVRDTFDQEIVDAELKKIKWTE